MRKLTLALYCRDTQVKRELFSMLRALPLLTLRSHFDLMCVMMLWGFSEEEHDVLLQVVPKDDNYYDEGWVGNVPPQLTYPSDVVCQASSHREKGEPKLEDVVFYDHPCAIAAREKPTGHGVLFQDYYGGG